MEIVIFIVKQPPMSMKIYLRDKGRNVPRTDSRGRNYIWDNINTQINKIYSKGFQTF